MDKDLDNVYKALKEQNKTIQRISRTLESLKQWVCNPPKSEFSTMGFQISDAQELHDTLQDTSDNNQATVGNG